MAAPATPSTSSTFNEPIEPPSPEELFGIVFPPADTTPAQEQSVTNRDFLQKLTSIQSDDAIVMQTWLLNKKGISPNDFDEKDDAALGDFVVNRIRNSKKKWKEPQRRLDRVSTSWLTRR